MPHIEWILLWLFITSLFDSVQGLILLIVLLLIIALIVWAGWRGLRKLVHWLGVRAKYFSPLRS